MHYHIPKPFFRKDRNRWFVQLRGKQLNLGADRDEAFKTYYQLMAAPEEKMPVLPALSGSGLLLTQLFDHFLDWVEKNRSAATYEWYRYRLQRFSDRHPKLTADAVRPYHVQEWVDSYPELSKTSVRNYMRSVKRSLAWAHRLGYVDKNPLLGLEIPSGEAKDVYFPPQQFQEFLSYAVDPNIRDLMLVTYACGCRPQESLRLEVRHVELAQLRWVLPRLEAKGKKAPRVVYLSDEAAEITARLISGRNQGFVFQNTRGSKWTPGAVKCALHRVQVRLGNPLHPTRS